MFRAGKFNDAYQDAIFVGIVIVIWEPPGLKL